MRVHSWAVVAAIGVVVGGTASMAVRHMSAVRAWLVPEPPTGSEVEPETDSEDVSQEPLGLAMRYALAVQNGNAEEVLRLVAWMNERLRRTDPSKRDSVTADLERRMLDRSAEGNQMRPEGVCDQYVFAPGATLETLEEDEGRSDLSEPVAKRVWIRVTYPSPHRALLNSEGMPIHSLEVGVNISTEGLVLKAGVLGNVDIDEDSLLMEWPSGLEATGQ